MKRFLSVVLTIWLGLLPLAAAAAPEPVTLEAMTHTSAEVTVLRPDGSEARYSPADLEALPTYRLRTTTPWREVPAAFDGVLLADLLAANGLDTVDAIEVTAENEYAVTIPREIWETLDVLVATRVDGQPHSRRARGPIQFVIDMDSYTASDAAREDYLVWMVARIEPAN